MADSLAKAQFFLTIQFILFPALWLRCYNRLQQLKLLHGFTGIFQSAQEAALNVLLRSSHRESHGAQLKQQGKHAPTVSSA